jgi:hypothetical protein
MKAHTDQKVGGSSPSERAIRYRRLLEIVRFKNSHCDIEGRNAKNF